MIAISVTFRESCDYDFWTNLIDTKSRLLQSYLVPIKTDCDHIRSVSDSRLHVYLVPSVTKIVIIFGAVHKNYCNHKWSSPIDHCDAVLPVASMVQSSTVK